MPAMALPIPLHADRAERRCTPCTSTPPLTPSAHEALTHRPSPAQHWMDRHGRCQHVPPPQPASSPSAGHVSRPATPSPPSLSCPAPALPPPLSLPSPPRPTARYASLLSPCRRPARPRDFLRGTPVSCALSTLPLPASLPFPPYPSDPHLSPAPCPRPLTAASCPPLLPYLSHVTHPAAPVRKATLVPSGASGFSPDTMARPSRAYST